MNIDSDGYQLVEKEFIFKTHKYTFMEDLGGDWRIYCQTSKSSGQVISYELVKIKRQEEFTVAKVIVPKKWAYPSPEMWGTRGFTFKSIKDCYLKFDKVQEESKSRKERIKSV